MSYDETLDATPAPESAGVFTHVIKKARENKAAGKPTNDEWFTPPIWVERVREVFGGTIDLDPTSCDEANEKFVHATKYFTIENCGLTQDWHGKVFMNPPYSRIIVKFFDKLITEYQSGRVTEAITLTHNCSDTKWFQDAHAVASAVCFPKRIRFYAPGSDPSSKPDGIKQTRGQAFLYFGKDPSKFAEVFGPHGIISYPRPLILAAQPSIDLAKTSGASPPAGAIDSIGPEPVASPPPRVRNLSAEDRAVLDKRCPDLKWLPSTIGDVMAWAEHSLPEVLLPFAHRDRWLVWKWVKAEGVAGDAGKLTKPPFQAATGMRHASSTDPDTWTSYQRAKSYVDSGLAHGLGFVLTDFGVMAFDLDKCFDANGDLFPSARKLVEVCASYCEWTPSRNGLRILGVAPVTTRAQYKVPMPEGWTLEVFGAGCSRYITVSGKPFEGYGVDVRDLGDIVAKFDARQSHDVERPVPRADAPDDGHVDDWERFRSAVMAIKNDATPDAIHRDAWVGIAACIHRTGHPDAAKLFAEFSKKRPRYKRRETLRVWNTLDKHPIPSSGRIWTAGSIYRLAEQNGWNDPLLGEPLVATITPVTDKELFILFPIEFWKELKRRHEQKINSTKSLKAA